jgi:hypothetical protein
LRKTSILFPTREREAKCKAALRSIFETSGEEVEVLIGFNEDSVYDLSEFPVKCFTFPREVGPSQRVHLLGRICTGDLIMTGGDDFIWKTKNWDTKLHNKEGVKCFYFNDGREVVDSRIPIVTKSFYNTVGYFPPYFFHFYGDTWVAEIAQNAGVLEYAPEVVIEHLHPKFGKSEWDQTYKNRGRPDKVTWEITRPEREWLTKKLLSTI